MKQSLGKLLFSSLLLFNSSQVYQPVSATIFGSLTDLHSSQSQLYVDDSTDPALINTADIEDEPLTTQLSTDFSSTGSSLSTAHPIAVYLSITDLPSSILSSAGALTMNVAYRVEQAQTLIVQLLDSQNHPVLLPSVKGIFPESMKSERGGIKQVTLSISQPLNRGETYYVEAGIYNVDDDNMEHPLIKERYSLFIQSEPSTPSSSTSTPTLKQPPAASALTTVPSTAQLTSLTETQVKSSVSQATANSDDDVDLSALVNSVNDDSDYDSESASVNSASILRHAYHPQYRHSRSYSHRPQHYYNHGFNQGYRNDYHNGLNNVYNNNYNNNGYYGNSAYVQHYVPQVVPPIVQPVAVPIPLATARVHIISSPTVIQPGMTFIVQVNTVVPARDRLVIAVADPYTRILWSHYETIVDPTPVIGQTITSIHHLVLDRASIPSGQYQLEASLLPFNVLGGTICTSTKLIQVVNANVPIRPLVMPIVAPVIASADEADAQEDDKQQQQSSESVLSQMPALRLSLKPLNNGAVGVSTQATPVAAATVPVLTDPLAVSGQLQTISPPPQQSVLQVIRHDQDNILVSHVPPTIPTKGSFDATLSYYVEQESLITVSLYNSSVTVAQKQFKVSEGEASFSASIDLINDPQHPIIPGPYFISASISVKDDTKSATTSEITKSNITPATLIEVGRPGLDEKDIEDVKLLPPEGQVVKSKEIKALIDDADVQQDSEEQQQTPIRRLHRAIINQYSIP